MVEVAYPQSVDQVIPPSEGAPWQSTYRPSVPWPGLFGYAVNLDDYEFWFATAQEWRHPAWLEAPGTQSFRGPIRVNTDGAAPVTIASGSISVPASQNLTMQLATAGQTMTFGATGAGLGNVLTLTPQANGNAVFGAAPNDATVTNRLTVGTLRTPGSTYALSGTRTPTAFSGTGSTATATFAAISGVVIPVGSLITITGASPSGYNVTDGVVTASTTTTVSWASSATGALVTAGSLAYEMKVPAVISMVSNWSGTAASTGYFTPYQFTIASDTSDTQDTGSGAPAVLIAHNWGGAAKGSKIGLRVVMTQTSATNDPVVPGVINQQHGAAELWTSAAYNAGGTGSNTLAAGSMYGTNPQTLLQSGATYWRLANALGEVNQAVYASRRTLTIGGTVTPGDTLSIVFTSADISGSPVTVTWTVGASQTLGMIANNLCAAVCANTALANAKVSAAVSGSVVTLYWYTHIAALTITTSTSGGATETMTLGSVVSGASVDIKLMGSMIRLAEDTAPGTLNSSFLMFGAQFGSGTAGLFNQGLTFGALSGYDSAWSWHKASTLIGAGVASAYGGAGQVAPLVPNWTKYGIDFSRVAFSSGASIWVPGLKVLSDNTGGVFVGGYKVAATSAGLTLDTTAGATASAVALQSGGGGGAGVATGNYFVGDVGFDAYGGAYEVATVNASTGAVATFNVLVYPSYQGSAPSNPLTVLGGSGTGWTVNATWPANPGLILQGSAGRLAFYAGTPVAKQTVSGAKAGNVALANLLTALASLGLLTDSTT